jgi:hypothetical protein
MDYLIIIFIIFITFFFMRDTHVAILGFLFWVE